ncbi:MAG: ORF2 [Guangxi mamastrovirus 1]|nr:MAG: ORF2 [Guangxi mamastrovirus 1]
MANNQNNVQPKVVTTTTTTTRRRGGRRRRRTPRTSAPNTTTVRKVTTTRQPGRPARRRRNRFGKSRGTTPGGIRQRITATLGTVGSNQGDEIELEMSNLLNPALMKETTGSNQYGPLQIYASTYSLWKLDYILLKLTPLVGGSAVSGTAIRASFNLSGQPGSPSWSALGARKHKDTSPGRPMTFYLSGTDIKGPKDGWFFCNTKNDPQMCLAGSLEIHTLGKTMRTYQNGTFDGPLFLVELTGQWSFKNYNPQPGMLNLVKASLKEKPQEVKIHGKPGEPIVISVPNNSALARTTGQTDLGVEADATPSEIVWQVADTVMDVVDGVLPAPFQWLFRAGWWFLKRIANKKVKGTDTVPGEPDAGEVTFQVFQSMTDAMNGTPCIATSTADTVNATVTGWNIMQVTPGNVGQAQETGAASRSAPLTLDSIEIVSTPELGRPAFTGHTYSTTPHTCIAVQEVGGQGRKVYTYSIWRLNHPTFMQNGQSIDPAQLQSHSYPILAKENNDFTPIGRVYAAGYVRLRTGMPFVHWTTVLWRADVNKEIWITGTNNATDQFLFIQPAISAQASSSPNTTYNLVATAPQSFQGGHRYKEQITKGDWYLSAFVTWEVRNGKEPEFINYGVPFYLGLHVQNYNSTYDPVTRAFEVGAAMQSTMPIILDPPTPQATSLTASEVAQLRQLLAPKDDYPPSEYDNLEMPPLEGEEEEEQGATGGYNPLEGARQQRVRGPEAVIKCGAEDTTPLLEDTEDEDDEDYESDLDDDDYADPPSLLKNIFTPEAKSLCNDLKRKGLDHDVAAKAAQVAFPHPALKLWEATYHNALVDGLSPPSARDCAWGAISDYI